MVGASQEAEAYFAGAVPNCDIEPIDNIDKITGFITSMAVFFLLPEHKKHPLWRDIKIVLDANTPYNYRTIEVTGHYDGRRGNHG